MKVAELIRRLQKCSPDVEVYFEETQVSRKDGILIGKYSLVNEVEEHCIRESDDELWQPQRVLLIGKEGDE